MHSIQKKILEYLESNNLNKNTLREIGKLIGEPDPQKPQRIKHHLQQLAKKGLITIDDTNKSISKVQSSFDSFVNIPILGSANCGRATRLAEQNFEGFLKVSNTFINDSENTFALKAVGNSMNRSRVNVIGSNNAIDSIEEGDYVIVDKNSLSVSDLNNKVVVSIIDGCANIKRFRMEGNRIYLLSESTENYPPIIINAEDNPDYFINGLVKGVFKIPK